MQKQFIGESIEFSVNSDRIMTPIHKRLNLNTFHLPQKLTQNEILDFKIQRYKTYRINIEENLCDLGLVKRF